MLLAAVGSLHSADPVDTLQIKITWKIYNIIYKVINSLRQLFVRGCVTPDGQKDILLNVLHIYESKNSR